MIDKSTRPQVVIIGAGFGGLEAARALAKAPVDVTVIDRRNHHLFQPLLYQVATAALSPAEIAWPIRHVLRRQRNARVLLGEVTSVDVEGRRVLTQTGAYPYDFLIVATGATHSYFGHAEWEADAPGLKTLSDALNLRQRVLSAFEEAELAEDPDEQARWLSFVVVGGGATGVEMAGAVAEVARHTLPREFRSIQTRSARIVLVEAGPRILPAMPEDLAAYARRALEKAGVTVMTATAVTGIDAAGVDLGENRVEAGTVVWAAGVTASTLARALPGEHDRNGRLVVGADLNLTGHPEVFVIGDAASVTGEDGKVTPGLAPAAKQAGGWAGKAIIAKLQGRTVAPFRYVHAGDLAAIGRAAAAVRIGGFRLTGFVGWLFWSVVHIYLLIGTRNRTAVALDWLWSWLTWQRSARLISED
jgi:NADH dehydrogenase